MRSSSMLVRVTSLVAVQSVTSISYQLRIDDPELVFLGARDGTSGWCQSLIGVSCSSAMARQYVKSHVV